MANIRPEPKPGGVLGLTKTTGVLKLRGEVMGVRTKGNNATVGVAFWKKSATDINIVLTKNELNKPKKITKGSDVIVTFALDKSNPIRVRK